MVHRVSGVLRGAVGARTWASVGVDDGDALFAGTVLEEALLRAIVTSASQTGEVE